RDGGVGPVGVRAGTQPLCVLDIEGPAVGRDADAGRVPGSRDHAQDRPAAAVALPLVLTVQRDHGHIVVPGVCDVQCLAVGRDRQGVRVAAFGRAAVWRQVERAGDPFEAVLTIETVSLSPLATNSSGLLRLGLTARALGWFPTWMWVRTVRAATSTAVRLCSPQLLTYVVAPSSDSATPYGWHCAATPPWKG